MARRPHLPVPGQLALDGAAPWQSSACECWPPVQRGCHHCTTCDTCLECGRCAGRGCICECEED